MKAYIVEFKHLFLILEKDLYVLWDISSNENGAIDYYEIIDFKIRFKEVFAGSPNWKIAFGYVSKIIKFMEMNRFEDIIEIPPAQLLTHPHKRVRKFIKSIINENISNK